MLPPRDMRNGIFRRRDARDILEESTTVRFNRIGNRYVKQLGFSDGTVRFSYSRRKRKCRLPE